MLFTIMGRGWLYLFLGGAGAGLCFQIYNGYWFFVPITGLALWLQQHDWAARLRSTVPWSLGCLTSSVFVTLLSTLMGGSLYWRRAFALSGQVTQGAFSEGWSLPWVYLWHAEHALGLLVIGAIVAALALDGWSCTPIRVKRSLILAATTYALFVLVSNGLELFVMYGRTARALVPFFCLAAGYATDRLLPGRMRWRALAAATVVACAAVNFVAAFALVFPAAVNERVSKTIGEPTLASSFTGPQAPMARSINRPDLVLVNAQLPYPLLDYAGYPPGVVLLSFPHAVSYAPYQFEGYRPRERRLLREHPPAIQLIELARPRSTSNRRARRNGAPRP